MPDYSELKKKFGQYCLFDEPAGNFTTYRAGGKAEVLVKPGCVADIVWLGAWCRRQALPMRTLGRGSNVLVSDKGLPGVTVLTERLYALLYSGNSIKVQAGALWDNFVYASAQQGLGGLQKTSGIPGSVGGALRMNAGAYGQEVFDRLVSVQALDAACKEVELKKKDIPHGYRRTEGLQDLILISAVFELDPGPPDVMLLDRHNILSLRAEKQPLDSPSAGSVFKRPAGDYASRLIDAAGLKGLRVGGAQVSPKHAGFIVNAGGATAADIYSLIGKVRAEVKAKTGISLELEQILLGEFN
ncbi:MAG TPA: hypothetical protein DCZ92_02425 [Elusimicrobia bacterium]|nr:MAG: UDP-N-acetylenolpyruvoylglucosamine reductase [Elusimicrobia bacterium GWF2_62_30]HBA59680.1 hypothetical protein [Elusimicrobiota bacterium]